MSMNSFHARTARPKPKAAAKPAPHPQGIRADALLVQQGLAASRSIARQLIADGCVSQKVGAGATAPLQKPAQLLPSDAVLTVTPRD